VKEQVLRLIGDSLNELGVHVDDVIYEKEGKYNYLRIVLDSEEMIDMERVVAATKIIDPLLDKEEIVKDDNYILDVYAKSKGDE